jgi:hypothetical protein
MSGNHRLAIFLSLIQDLRASGCPTGDAHFQIGGVILQELLGVPLEMNVILYFYSIYAPETDAGVSMLWADELLRPRVGERPWPTYHITEGGVRFLAYYAAAVEPHLPAIRFVAERLAPLSIQEVMGLGTALYVWQQHPDWPALQQAAEVARLNPNRDSLQALDALKLLARLRAESEALKRRDPAPAA